VTITLDGLSLFFLMLGMFGFGLAMYKRGQRKGLEDAEELYEPLIEAMKARSGEEEQ
jgi:hypothetical protein